jgi:hypothetical protein
MKKLPTDKPTMEEVSELVTFERVNRGKYEGILYIRDVKGVVVGSVHNLVMGDIKNSVMGNILGDVRGDVRGGVLGTINGREWKFVETPKERVARLIREGKSEEAIQVMENEL